MFAHLKYYTGKVAEKVGFFTTFALAAGLSTATGIGTYEATAPELDVTGSENRQEVKEAFETELSELRTSQKEYNVIKAMKELDGESFSMLANWHEFDERIFENEDEFKKQMLDKSVALGYDLFNSDDISETDFQELAEKFNAVKTGIDIPAEDQQIVYADECRLTDPAQDQYQKFEALKEMQECLTGSNSDRSGGATMVGLLTFIGIGFGSMVLSDSRALRRIESWGDKKPKKKTPAPKN